MSEAAATDALFAAAPWADAPGATIELRAKYLNYDVADELKPLLLDAARRLVADGARTLVLDLSQVSVVDSCGVGLMIGLQSQVRESRGSLWLVGVSSFLQKIFRMMHLDKHFQVAAGEEEVRQSPSSPVV